MGIYGKTGIDGSGPLSIPVSRVSDEY